MWSSILLGIVVLVLVVGVWFAIYFWMSLHVKDPDGKARLTGSLGDTMEISFQVKNNKIGSCSYWSDGCVYSVNCACKAADLARGKTLQEALNIDADVIRESIGGLPKDHYDCAALAADTLHEAIRSYMKKGNTKTF